MARISIVESVGGSIQNVTNYRDLENHHPSQALQERGRVYARVGGESEEILGDYRGTAVLTSGGNYMVSKDMVLKSPGLDNSQVPIPSPAAGVIGKIDRADGVITINDPKTGDTMFQIRHAKIDPNLKPGDRVEYGQPLGLQHGYNNGNPQAFGDHVHFDVNTKYIAQADKWIKDMHNGTITTDRRPGPTENIVTERPTFVPISGNFPKPADPPLADGKLSLGEKGPEVEKLQKALVAAGARDAEGKAINPDSDFGNRTKQAVESYQRTHNQPVTGVADDKMLRELGVIGQQQNKPAQPTPTPTEQNTTPTQPNTPTQPQQPTGNRVPGGPTDFGANNTLGALISSGEGNYNSFNRGRAGDSGGKEIDFSQMTVAEVMRRQDLASGDPNRLFAVGKYQVIPGTMEEAVKALNVDPNAKFTPQLQERIFADYLIDEKRPSVRDYITGKTGPEGLGRAQLALAQEFASVADPRTGKSFYDGDSAGNSASISAKQVGDALNQMREQYQQNVKSGLSPSESYRALSGDPTAPMHSTALADGKLSQGEKGPDVEKLQKALVAAGARDAEGKALNPDGDFGGRTKQAVENYQRANNQPVTGVADTKMLTDLGVIAPQQAQPQPNTPQPNTPAPKPNDPVEAKPNAPTTNTPQPTAPEKLSGTYQEGDSGEGVRKLQERLNERMGLNIATDGKYGPLTEASVLLYQHQNGLKTDGIAGPNTLAKLNEPVQQAAVSNSPPSITETPQAQTTNATPNAQTASTNTVTPAVEPTKPNPAQTEPVKPSAQDGFSIKPGDTGPAVVELQKVMQTHGSMCSCGTHGLTTDGKYGPITEQAVKTYQLLNDIAPANGVANEETLKKLGLDPKQLQAMQAQPNKDVSAVPNDKVLMTHPDNAANPRFNEVMKVFDTLPAGTFKSDQEKTTKAVDAAAESLIGERKLDKVESAKLVNGTIYLGDKPNISDQTTNLSFVSLASNRSIEESSKAVNAVNAAQEKPAEVKGDQKAQDKVPDPTLVNPAIENRPKVYMA